MTAKPDASAAPDVSASPDVSAAPDVSAEPDVSAAPSAGLRDVLGVDVDPMVLVALLQRADVADRPTADVLRVVAGWQQVMGIAAAAQAEAVAELAERRPRSSSFPVDDIACALSTTTHGAQALVSRADGLADHPVLAEALRAGLIDARKTDVLLAETDRLPQADADRVLRELLEENPGLTAPLFREEARRLVAAVDPDAARKRAARARTERCVRLEHAGDAMAWVSALLPAADAVSVFSVIDTLARAAEAEADVRTLPQRRADALSDVFATILATGATPDGRRLPTRQGEPLSLHLTLAASTFAGADDLPGELRGYGPIPAAVARDLARAARRFRPVLTDDEGRVLVLGERTRPTSLLRRPPASPAGATSLGPLGPPPRAGAGRRSVEDPAPGSQDDFQVVPKVGYRPDAALVRLVLARDGTCRFPGCRQPADACDIDHIEPFDTRRPAAEQTRPDNLQALCRHHHLAKTHHGWSMRRNPDTGDVLVTSPLGLDYVRPATTILLTESAYRHGATRASTGSGGARAGAAERPGSRDEPPPPF
jgi:hypothetical protein